MPFSRALNIFPPESVLYPELLLLYLDDDADVAADGPRAVLILTTGLFDDAELEPEMELALSVRWRTGIRPPFIIPIPTPT